MNRTVSIIIGVVIALALAGGAFWEGMNVGKAQAQDEQNAFFASRGFDPNAAGGGQGGQGGAGGFGGFGGRGGAGRGQNQNGATGTIQSISGNTITLTTTQGDTVQVQVTADTPVLESTAGKVSDLKPGTHILAIGTRSGNNVSARGIQVTDRPAGFDNLFGGGPRQTPTPTTGTSANK
jgi:hypothetical protein